MAGIHEQLIELPAISTRTLVYILLVFEFNNLEILDHIQYYRRLGPRSSLVV